MGIFGSKKIDLGSLLGANKSLTSNPMAILGGYDRNAAMQGQSGFAPMNSGMPQKKQGFFSKGGGWVDALGAFGDAFGTNGPVYAHQKQQQNNLMRQQQMAEQNRQQEREDYIWKAQYERANPKPVNNDTVNDLNWYKSLPEEDRKLYHQMKPVISYMADGTPRVVNPYDTQPKSGPQVGAVEDGFMFKGGNPSNPNAWEKIGGQSGLPAGTFPAPRH
jgi:hypothetical protein